MTEHDQIELLAVEEVPDASDGSRPEMCASRPPYPLNTQQLVYVWLCSLFVTCLIIADVIGVKLFQIRLPFSIMGFEAIEHTCGMLTFPATFLLGDIINEYYGALTAKRTVYIGLAMSIFVFIILNISQAMPFLDKPFNVTPEAFDSIFGSSKLMYIASVIAYLLGQLCDIWLFGVIKKRTGGKMLWLRATGSTIASQMLDSFVVSYVAFGIGKTITGQPGASIGEILNIAATGYMLKFVAAASITPLLYGTRRSDVSTAVKYQCKNITFVPNFSESTLL